MNDRMAKFFEEKAMEKQTVSISDKEGIDGYREHLDEKQLKFYRDEIETVEPCDITLDGFEINEMPSLMRQSLNTVKAFNKQVSSFERDAINDLTLRVHKRSRLLPDDHEIPSVLDKKDASKVKEIETTENILHLLIQPSENKNQPE
jgi:hypothetical protein